MPERLDTYVHFIDRELESVLRKRETNHLKYFSLCPAVWEFLLLVYKFDGNSEFGISDYVGHIRTRQKSLQTLHRFISARIAAGSLLVVPSKRKNQKTLTLCPELKSELEAYLEWLVVQQRPRPPFPKERV